MLTHNKNPLNTGYFKFYNILVYYFLLLNEHYLFNIVYVCVKQNEKQLQFQKQKIRDQLKAETN